MHDPMEDLLDVRDDIDRATQRFERAAARRTDTEGTDPDGVVSVSVTAEGRLTAVRVSTGWQARLDGADAAGLTGPHAPTGNHYVAARWRTYVAVDDVDATCAAVEQAGDVVIGEPADAGTQVGG